MSYSISIKKDHLYVQYSGVVDTLDIVRLTKDETFINNLRSLQKLIHNFSNAEAVTVSMEDIKDVILMANMESNFTENLIEVIIPTGIENTERVEALSKAIKSPHWTVLLATSYEDALTKIST